MNKQNYPTDNSPTLARFAHKVLQFCHTSGARAVAVFACGLVLTPTALAQDGMMKPPFGTPEETKYAAGLWKALQKADLIGPNAVNGVLSQGKAPHGAVVEATSKNIRFKGHLGAVHVKRNYGGTPAEAAKMRTQSLMAITVMFQREQGYDSDNDNWFWAKYMPDGSLDKGPNDMPLAGRVAKGMDMGCIACHSKAEGGDYLFLDQ